VRVTAIVLGAGGSSRLGRPKQLLPFRNTTLIEHAANVALASCDHVRVVVNEKLRGAVVSRRGIEIVENSNWREGIASSIRRGLEGIGSDVLLMVCDQPFITAVHLRALIAANAPIAATAYDGTAGVPAFFAARFLAELRELRGDRGARAVIERHGAVTIPFEAAALDIDTERDAATLNDR